MKKKIVIGCLLTVFVIMLLPSTSVAESNIIKKQAPLEQHHFIDVKDNPVEPTCVLRLLLWIRNLLAAGILIVIIKTLMGITNQTGI